MWQPLNQLSRAIANQCLASIFLFILTGASECFAMATIYALAYTRAAPAMKGITTALFLFTMAISAAISLAVTPALKDPYLVVVFAVVGGVAFLAGVLLFVHFFNLHKTMEQEEKERIAMGQETPESTKLEELEPVSSVYPPLDVVTSKS